MSSAHCLPSCLGQPNLTRIWQSQDNTGITSGFKLKSLQQPLTNRCKQLTRPQTRGRMPYLYDATARSSLLDAEPFVECSSEFVGFAEELADIAGAAIRPYFRQPIPIDTKSDASPVTIADKSAEEAITKWIRKRFPDHAILGEENGLDLGSGDGDYVWVIDPIDGTASFITGKPLFGTLIALLHQGTPVLGILDQPIIGERWVGVAGQGTTFNGSVVRTRQVSELSEAYMYTTSPHLFPGESEGSFEKLRKSTRRINYGCDCYAFGLLALGFVDIALEFGVKPWDYLALVPIVEGAGGRMTDWEGNRIRLASFSEEDWVGHVVACGSEKLHTAAIELLDWK